MLLFLLNCSVRSGRSKLKQWHAHTSYNNNGKYYALPEVPRFDMNGLWWHRGAYFSKHGTLKNTVVHLVGASSAGLNGVQIGRLVGLDPRSFLCHLRDAPGIQREKHQGVYVYFSDDESIYLEQVASRLEEIAGAKNTNQGRRHDGHRCLFRKGDLFEMRLRQEDLRLEGATLPCAGARHLRF